MTILHANHRSPQKITRLALDARRQLIAILAIALLLRLVWAAIVPVVPVADSFLYREFALNMANGRGYVFPNGHVTAYWPVGTSAMYAVLFKLFGTSNSVIVVLNLALGVAIVALSYLLAKPHFGHRVAIVAALLVAIWPALIQFTSILASELLFIFCLLFALYCWQSRVWPHAVRGILWGAALCAAVYVRPTALPLFLLFPLMEFWRQRDWQAALVSFLAACAMATAMFSPWVIRNHQVFGSFVLVSTNFGPNLWMGNNPSSEGATMDLPDVHFDNEVTREKHYKRAALDYIQADPLRYTRLTAQRFVMTHDRESIGVAWNEPGLRQTLGAGALLPLKALSSAYWWVAALFALGGFGLALRRKIVVLSDPCVLVPLMFAAVPALTVGQDRYHLPLVPFVAAFAALAIVSLCDRTRERSKSLHGADHGPVPTMS